MLTILTESKLKKAKDIFSSFLNENERISKEWLKKSGLVVALVDGGLDLYYGLAENVQRFQSALCSLESAELLAASHQLLTGSQILRYSGSKLLGTTEVELTSPVVVAVPNNIEAIRLAFSDVLLASDVVVTDLETSFVLLDDLSGEHGVIAGQQSFVESCLGMSIEESWAEWDLDIASYGF